MGVARVQDSATGVFLSADSLISDPGYTQSYNRYGYVNNNPLSCKDPSGHCPHNNGYTPPDNNGPGYELEEVVVYAYIDDSRSTDYSLADLTPFDWGLLRDWYNDYFNNNNVDSAPAKRAPVPQTQKPTMCLSDTAINAASGAVGGAVTVGTAALLTGQVELLPVLVGAGAVGGAIAGGTNSNLFSSTSGVALNVALLATGHASLGEALVGAGGEVANSYGGGPSTMVGVSMATGAASGVFIKEMYGSVVTRGAGAVLGASAGGKAALLGFLKGRSTQGLLRSYNQWRGCSP